MLPYSGETAVKLLPQRWCNAAVISISLVCDEAGLVTLNSHFQHQQSACKAGVVLPFQRGAQLPNGVFSVEIMLLVTQNQQSTTCLCHK